MEAVIGQYADYYIEWDGMVEMDPGVWNVCRPELTFFPRDTLARCG